MINFVHPSTDPENQSKRLTQLDGTVELQEWRILRESRSTVEAFLRLGRKWGFFELSEEDTMNTGREVLMNAYMPEGNLAIFINGKGKDSLAKLEQVIDGQIQEDSKALARLLISGINDRIAVADLESERDPSRFIGHISSASTASLPEWFKVIKIHRMGPADLEMIYARMDREGVQATEDTISGCN